MSASTRKDENTTSSFTSTCATKKPRSLKRTLKVTVVAGLGATAAGLLARSEEIGEWLQSVAPNVMPHAEAGAEIVQRAIAEAKTCIQEGANVCLDAEGRVTALCESGAGRGGGLKISFCMKLFGGRRAVAVFACAGCVGGSSLMSKYIC